jgi:hypothetical protein
MAQDRYITGNSADEVKQLIQTDLAAAGVINDYQAVIKQGNTTTYLTIQVQLGGAEEGGYELTILRTPFHHTGVFQFQIYPQDFLQEVGKFFGMEDIQTGYPAFDDATIVKTNDAAFIKNVVADEQVRSVFGNLSGYSLSLDKDNDTGQWQLLLEIQRGLTDTNELLQVYDAYLKVLQTIQHPVQ